MSGQSGRMEEEWDAFDGFLWPSFFFFLSLALCRSAVGYGV